MDVPKGVRADAEDGSGPPGWLHLGNDRYLQFLQIVSFCFSASST
jgi:hypothetical protein